MIYHYRTYYASLKFKSGRHYLILNLILLNVLLNINRCISEFDLRQAISVILQVIDGIHKLLDPVSNITLNVCPGVPISIGP